MKANKKSNLKPCPFCGKQPIIEQWYSGEINYMVKCNNPDCPVPENGYPSGRDLKEVKDDWNRRTQND